MSTTRLFPAAVLTAALACPAAAAETLRIYNWADYFAPTTLEDFTAATGIATTLDLFDGNETLETKLLAGGSGYDVVFPASSNAQREAAAGALLPIDPSRLANYGKLDPTITAVLDAVPGWRTMGVPYMWGTIGIAWNVEAVEARLGTRTLDSLSVFFDPATAGKLKDCGLVILDSPLEVIAVALNHLGKDPYSDDPADLAAAEAMLAASAPSIAAFSNQRATDGLANGDVCAALIYSGDAELARMRAEEAGGGRTIAYAIPKEGTMMWVDLMAIPADAPNPDLAYRFIDHMLTPSAIAAVTDAVGFANANGEATALVDPAISGNPNLYPDGATMARLFPDRSLGARAVKARNRIWTRVKTGD